MQLMDMTGTDCGNFDSGDVPQGYWTRSAEAPNEMAPLTFLDKIGPVRFGGVWMAALANPAVAYPLVRGLAAQTILIADSFPALVALEQAGVLPSGTAIEVWS